MGVTLHVENSEGRSHPTWEAGRFGGDRDLVDTLLFDEESVHANLPDAFHEGAWRPGPECLKIIRETHGWRGEALADIFEAEDAEQWWFVPSW